MIDANESKFIRCVSQVYFRVIHPHDVHITTAFPFAPVVHCIPCGPVAPVAPIAHGVPFVPLAPVTHCIPCGPVAHVAPVAQFVHHQKVDLSTF